MYVYVYLIHVEIKIYKYWLKLLNVNGSLVLERRQACAWDSCSNDESSHISKGKKLLCN